tara:strand:- start:44 stop:481 length:438 start_codon:yes stop_codon:yes gene_type:complete
MENDKLDEDFEHDLCQVLTKYYGDNWSNVWDKEADGFYLRLKVFGNILTKEDIPIVDDETDKVTYKKVEELTWDELQSLHRGYIQVDLYHDERQLPMPSRDIEIWNIVEIEINWRRQSGYEGLHPDEIKKVEARTIRKKESNNDK